MKKVFSFAILLLLIGLVGCSTDEQNDALITERNNPYDYIGLRHNEGLDYIATHYKGGGEEEAYKLIDEYGASKNEGVLSGFPYITLNGTSTKYQTTADQYTSAKAYVEANQAKYKELDRTYYFAIANIVDDFIEKHQDFNKFKSLIAKIESQILNDKEDISKPALLGMTSVAIHSAEYWLDYYTNPNNLYRKIKPIAQVQSRYILPYCTVVDIVAYSDTYDYFMSTNHTQSYSDMMATNQAIYSSARCEGGF